MSRFRLSPGGRRPHEPWFHIGALEVTTTWLVVLLSIVGILLFAVVGGGSVVEANLALIPPFVTDSGKVWTLLTWPFAYPGLSLLALLGIFFFWYFGRDLERELFGKGRWAAVLGLWTLFLGLILLGIYELAPGSVYSLDGMSLVGINVFLLWIAEWPSRMFIFNIPAWVVGVVYVAIEVISYAGDRQWPLLWTFLIGLVVCAFIARQFGALNAYAWIPKLVGTRPHRPHRPKRSRSAGRSYPPDSPTVVPGPWETPSANQRDEDRMNELLDKIGLSGVDSLSSKERAELDELRLRRRRS